MCLPAVAETPDMTGAVTTEAAAAVEATGVEAVAAGGGAVALEAATGAALSAVEVKAGLRALARRPCGDTAPIRGHGRVRTPLVERK